MLKPPTGCPSRFWSWSARSLALRSEAWPMRFSVSALSLKFRAAGHSRDTAFEEITMPPGSWLRRLPRGDLGPAWVHFYE
jgi:hypothetical protein